MGDFSPIDSISSSVLMSIPTPEAAAWGILKYDTGDGKNVYLFILNLLVKS